MYKKNTFLCKSRFCIPIKLLLIMKLSFILVLTTFLQLTAAESNAQRISMVKQNASLQHILKDLETQTTYNFIYNANMLRGTRTITLNLKHASVTEILDKCFENQPLSYLINGNTIIIVAKTAGQPDKKTVRGKVVDEGGVALPGVTVRVKNTGAGVVTDTNGNYTIEVPDNSAVLVFSLLGFGNGEAVVGDRTSVDMVLQEDTEALSEVIVTALGIKREERALGYAITKVDSTQLTDAISGNWIDALSGKVAGLNMIRSGGGPAGSNKIILRGENNLTGENEALIVVDGVVISTGSGRRTATGGVVTAPDDGVQPTDFGSGLNDINPEDIESVTVLKGPAAAALYGQRGANGAIMITTKSGNAKRKTVGITVTSNGAMESANRWPDLQYEYGQGLNGESYYSYGVTPDGPNNGNTSVAWGARFNGQHFYQYDPVTQTTGTERTPWVAYPNQSREFFESGKTFTNSISFDGNLKGTTYRVSATHGDNTWIIPNTGFKRTNVSLSTNTKITPKLNLSVKANYTNRRSDNLPGMGYGNQSVMYWYVFWVPNGDINWLRNYWVNDKEHEELHDIFTTAPENPYAISYEFINGSNRHGVTGNAQVSYQLTKELGLQVRASLDRTNDDRWQHRPWTAYRLPMGAYRTQDIISQEVTADFLLKYDKKLNEDFRITANLGGSRLQNHYYKNENRADGLVEPNVYRLDNAAFDLVHIPDTSRFEINSFYGLFSAGYKDYLYLDLTGRQDWSSTLATPLRTDNTGFFYPSASLSFIASEYFRLPKAVSFMKWRLSMAGVGSGGTRAYLTSYLYNLAANGIYPDSSLSNPVMIPNPDLQPLKTITYEVGTEVKLFNNRLGFDVALYTGNTKNQILERIVDRAAGYTRQLINAGQIDNKGIEIAVNVTPVQINDFKWTSYMTYAANRNKIVALANNDSTVVLRTSAVGGGQIVAKVGGSMGDMWGIGFERAPDGQVVYSENGVPLLTSTPVYLGNTMPKFRASIGNDFRYKQFRLHVLFDGQYGAVAHSYTHARLADFGKLQATVPGRYSGIIGHGVIRNPDGSYRPNDVAVIGGQLLRTAFYPNIMGTPNAEGATYKTDFIKLRELRIDYSLPRSVLKSLKLTKANIGLYGRNLFIWSTWPMFDPEFGTLAGTDIVQGFEVGQFPSTRTYGFSLSVGI